MAEPELSKKHRPRVIAFTGWTIFFFVLLRVAIGWHFLYEGVWKVKEGTFSATPYLLASQGPFKGVFRWMVFDADGFKRMEPSYQIARLDEAEKRIANYYRLTPDQEKNLKEWKTKAQENLKSLGMPAAEIAKLRSTSADQLASVYAKFGDTLTDMTPVVTKPKETIIVALDRMRANGVNELPVFDDNEQLVAILKKSDIEVAATQPASPAAEPAKVEKYVPAEDKSIKELGSALIAADYQNALESYKQLLAQVTYEEARMDPKFRAQRLDYNQKKVNTARQALLARIELPMTLIESVGTPAPPPDKPQPPDLKLTPEQVKLGPVPSDYLTKFPYSKLNHLKIGRLMELRFTPKTLTKYIDLMMMFGLVAIGICLILGLFTRFASFCAILMLAMFYFSMPPWPGTVDPPNVEGHYLVVNKNLIELIACLMIMSSRIGRWCGLDAFFGAIADRRRRKRAEREAVLVAQSPRDRVLVPGEARPGREPVRL